MIKKKLKKNIKEKKLKSTKVHSINPLPATWDCDKKII